jgi:uncharacterized protein (TIGR03435 family)
MPVRLSRHIPLFRALLASGSLALAPSLFAQTPPPAPSGPTPATTTPTPALTFDVASIRQNTSVGGRNHINISTNDGHFTFTTGNATLKSILHFAFALPESQIVDAPAWVDSTNFDIVAKAGPDADAQLNALSGDQNDLAKQLMVQALLADRFRLKTHRETRQLPIYDLVVANPKTGPKLLPTEAHGTTIDNNKRSIRIIGGDDSVELLAEYLAKTLGRNVVDKTALTGRYDINLKWTPEDAIAANADPAPDAPPDIFTAIQEQLGLKLESTKAPVPVLVIDHIEMPSEN